jgi:hypothetical protein
MNKVQFHLLLSDYSSITYSATMGEPCENGRIALRLEQNDLVKAVRKGMRCRISNRDLSLEGVVDSHNGLSITCRAKERSMS